MPLPNLQLGTFVLNIELLVYVAAGMIGVLALRFRLREYADRARLVSDAWNAVFLWIAVWKASLLLLDPAAVVAHPLSLLFFSGGVKGIWLASASSLGFIFLRSYRKEGIRRSAAAATIWGAGMASAALLAHLVLSSSAGNLDYAGFIAAIILLAALLSPSPRRAAQALGTLLVAAMVVYTVLGPTTSRNVRSEQSAPDFELTDLNGNSVRLSDYRGKTIVMNFWATWCRVCQAEMPHVEKFYQNNKDGDIVVISVNATSQERSAAVVEKYAGVGGMSFPIALDPQGDVLKQYGVTAFPTTYIIDPSGKVKNRYLGAISYDDMTKAAKTRNS
ncbi:peroxiredoxin family protein [Cohnella terricola]|uniref:TlpA family protein disulfide reductase n=1 Tax=Cohnella terricola TaxID=1289167 RepID=A0A559JIP2_9BACL|nr:TlpA disulfide reductase family protein [Cohnella terricola]TVX99739.1 TlpA family protein disulfide reductase [Cohnella terricola]